MKQTDRTAKVKNSSGIRRMYSRAGGWAGRLLVLCAVLCAWFCAAAAEDEQAPGRLLNDRSLFRHERDYDIVLLMGQSNAGGRGVTSAAQPEAAPILTPGAGLEFRAISDPTRMYILGEPFGLRENNSDGIDDGERKTGSLMTAFVNEYYRRTGTPVVGVSASKGGTAIRAWQPGGAYLDDAIARLTACRTFMRLNGYRIGHIYMIWCQGESDGDNGTSPQKYKERFCRMLEAMRAAGVEKCFLCRIGEYNGADGLDYGDIIRAQNELAHEQPDVIMGTTALAGFRDRGLMRDAFHYYQAAYNGAGRLLAAAMANWRRTGQAAAMYDPRARSMYFSYASEPAPAAAADADTPENPQASGAQPQRRLTLMVYMCGSNLESAGGTATADLQEMLNAGIPVEEVSVLVLAGGSGHWANSYPADRLVLAEIGPHRQRVLELWEPGSMGAPETLTRFLQYGAEHRPAEEYALILWGHGGGPMEGVCWDERFGGDRLTLDEITDALARSPFGQRKLNWIGFDAGLMGTVEVAGRLAPYADYMIASQAEEPAGGWNYAFLRDIGQDAGAAETGRRIVDAYFEGENRDQGELTLACTDLSRVGEIERLMSDFYQKIADRLSRASFPEIAKLRFGATGFGKSRAPLSGNDGYDLADLVFLTECCAVLDPEGAESLREAVAQAVFCSRTNEEGSHGLSVYHPFRNQRKFAAEWGSRYGSVSGSPGYAAYVDAYGRIMSGEQLARWNHLDRLRWEADRQELSCYLTRDQAENLASARLAVFMKDVYDTVDESYYRVYMSDDVQLMASETEGEEGAWLRGAYRGETIQAFDEHLLQPVTGALSCRMTEEGTYLVDLYPHGNDQALPDRPVMGEYAPDPESGEMTLTALSVYDELTGVYTRRAAGNPGRYQGVTFLCEYRNPLKNEMGEILPFDAWPLDQHDDPHRAQDCSCDGPFRLRLSVDGQRSEALYAAFELTDTQGNTYMTDMQKICTGVIPPESVQAVQTEQTNETFR